MEGVRWFFNIRIILCNSEPEITTLVLMHGKAAFDFKFFERIKKFFISED